MRSVIILIVIALLSIKVTAQQNLISNESFETYSQCPSSFSQTDKSTGWRQYGTGTSDYFNSCAGGGIDIPVNNFGYQFAVHGQAYMGGTVLSAGTGYREYFAKSITAMQPGVAYEASMYVSLADKSVYATNNLGMYFYDNGPNSVSYNYNLPVTPQVFYTNYAPITDTQNWVRLKKVFLADSAYDNVVIGGFLPDSSVTKVQMPSGNIYPYYYYDSISIVKFSGVYILNADTLLCAGDTFQLSYYASDSFTNTNTFTAQLSNATGSFSSPKNIGSVNSDTTGMITCIIPNTVANGVGYRVRIITTSKADTSEVYAYNIKIGNPDSANIVVSSNSPLCSGNTLNLTASTNVSSATYNWTGPNSFTSSAATPSISGAGSVHAGNYYSLIKFYGCEVNDTINVVVKPTPAKPSVSSNSAICSGDTLNLFSSSSTSGISYSWTGPNGYTSSLQNPIVANSTATMTGIYTATASLNGCASSDTTAVLVKQAPAAVTLSNNGNLCDGDTLQLNATISTTGTSYSWTGPLLFTANTRNAIRNTVSPSMSGWYKLQLELNGCVVIDSTQVSIYPIPATPVISYGSPLCVGDTLRLTASNVTGASYSWTGPSNFSSPFQNPQRVNISLSDTGYYTVETSANGCTSEADSVHVIINAAPFVVIYPSVDSICEGGSVTFNALPNNTGGAPTYQWFVNAQFAGISSTYTTTSLKKGDIVNCAMTEYTKCYNDYTDQSNDVQIAVLPWLAPSVTISANPAGPVAQGTYISFTAMPVDAGNNPNYQWKRNGNNVLGANSGTWSANTLSDNDSVSVEIVSDYACPQPTTAISNGIIVKIISSIGNVDGLNDIRLYPNPNNGKFVIDGTVKSGDDLTLEILNVTGQILYKDVLKVSDYHLYREVGIDSIASGIYLLRLTSENGSIYTTRFSIE